MALLCSAGFYDIHFLHGGYEFGKDFIAKVGKGGTVYQYAFQSKAGDINLAGWGRGLWQIDLLRQGQLAHPSFDLALPRKAALVTTGRLVGGALPVSQDYCQQLIQAGEVPLEIWDREKLIELMKAAVSTGLAERTEGPLLGTIAFVDDRTITDLRLVPS